MRNAVRCMEKLVLYFLGLLGYQVRFPLGFLDTVNYISHMPQGTYPAFRLHFPAPPGGILLIRFPFETAEPRISQCASGQIEAGMRPRPISACGLRFPERPAAFSEAVATTAPDCGLHFPARPGAAW